MVKTLRDLLGVTLFTCCLIVAAACDDDGDGVVADAGGPDAVTDAPPVDVGGVCDTVNTDCFTPNPSAGTNPRLLLEAVRFDVNLVVLKNVSGSDINFDGWQICQRPDYQAIASGFTLANGAKVTLHLGESGTNTDRDVFISSFPDLTTVGEIAIYRSSNFDSPSDLVAYVRWGAPATGETRQSEAVSAGQWTTGDFVPVCGDNVGIVAVGDVTRPQGWRDLPASCF